MQIGVVGLGRMGGNIARRLVRDGQDPKLEGFTGVVADSGEGRWTVVAAIEEAVPANVLSAALNARFRSGEDHAFADRLLSAMGKEFGGHIEAKGP